MLLYVLIVKGVVKYNIVENIVGLGLNLFYFYKIFQRDGEDGFRVIFVQKNFEGQVWVFFIKCVFDFVILKFVEYFEKNDVN